MARNFFYVSLGVLALALAYHFGTLGATSAGKMARERWVGLAVDSQHQSLFAMTSEGDVWFTSVGSTDGAMPFGWYFPPEAELQERRAKIESDGDR